MGCSSYYRLFGGEELSQRSQVIQQRMDNAYLTVEESGCHRIKALSQGQQTMFTFTKVEFTLPVKISASLNPRSNWPSS